MAIVAVDREGFVTLVRQLREPARARLLELPAGTLEPGEEPLETAQRELREECGLTGGEWRSWRRFWTTPGFCRERMHLYARRGRRSRSGEARSRRPTSETRARPLARATSSSVPRLGEIEDAKTVAGLLLYLPTLREATGAATSGAARARSTR